MLYLETERLVLRDFLLADWDALHIMLSDPEVRRFSYFAFWDEAECREWFTSLIQDTFQKEHDACNWAITLKSSKKLIGWFGIGGASDPVEAERGARSCGYALNRQFWGQGYMPETMRAIFAYEWATLGTSRIIASCDVRNPASARVMEKCGMTYEGTFEDEDGQGYRANRHHYAISKRQIPALA